MKRHRPNATDTISKALLARKLVGRRQGKSGGKAGPSASGQTPENRGCTRANHYGLRNPLFKLRTYLHKMRGTIVHDSVPGPRDIIWSCAGAFIGIFILVRLDAMLFTGDQLLLLGSFGASSLIIFGAPHSNFAQPRSVIGGQVLSAFAGAVVYALLGDQLTLAAPLAVSLAFGVMQVTGTMHPPGGATALIAGSGQHIALEMGILYPLMPVGAGVTLLFLVGILINNLSRNRQYPLRWF